MDQRQQDDEADEQQRPEIERRETAGGDGPGDQGDKSGISGHGGRIWRAPVTGAMRDVGGGGVIPCRKRWKSAPRYPSFPS